MHPEGEYPDRAHRHWCGFCGAELWFSALQCKQLIILPPCPRCWEASWRYDPTEP